MWKLMIPAMLAGAVFLPGSAGAAVIASSSLTSGQISVTFSNPPEGGTGELFSTASAALGPTGVNTADNNPLPGVADAPAAVDGTMSADSALFVLPDEDNISFMTEADGSVGFGEFGTAIGEVTGTFDFTNTVAGTIIEIIMDLTQVFNLETGVVGDTASGATSIALSILTATGVLLPTISLSDPTCNPNAAFSVTDGDTFSSSCTGTATFTFAALETGDFTLTFASNSSVDLVGAIPIPGAVGLFGLGVLGLALFGVTTRPRRSTQLPSLI